MNDAIFWSVLTSKRDEALAHITDLIERSGMELFCGFLTEHVLPILVDESGEKDNEGLIKYMAAVGAIDALLAYRDAQGE